MLAPTNWANSYGKMLNLVLNVNSNIILSDLKW